LQRKKKIRDLLRKLHPKQEHLLVSFQAKKIKNH